MGTPLMIGPTERAALHELRERANAHPVDASTLRTRLATPDGKSRHRDQMTIQTVRVPLAYLVTFSIETGHPKGTFRHMSISVQRDGRVPNLEGVWLIAQALGFTGSLDECIVYLEDLEGHGKAVNVLQVITAAGAATAQ
jgi:hypothetical protein